METTVNSSDQLPTLKASGQVRPKTKPYLLKSIRAGITEATEGKTIHVVGVEVSAEELFDSGFLSPLILSAAAAHIRSSNQVNTKNIDFSFDLETDADAVLMVKVSHIAVSSPRALKSAIVQVLKNAENDGAFYLDNCLEQFGEFFAAHLGAAWEESFIPDGQIFTIEA